MYGALLYGVYMVHDVWCMYGAFRGFCILYGANGLLCGLNIMPCGLLTD